MYVKHLNIRYNISYVLFLKVGLYLIWMIILEENGISLFYYLFIEDFPLSTVNAIINYRLMLITS